MSRKIKLFSVITVVFSIILILFLTYIEVAVSKYLLITLTLPVITILVVDNKVETNRKILIYPLYVSGLFLFIYSEALNHNEKGQFILMAGIFLWFLAMIFNVEIKDSSKDNFFIISPESNGYLGKRTKLFSNSDPSHIKHLHYEIDTWQEGSIVESFPNYIITEELADSIKNSDLKGYEVDSCETTFSDSFKSKYPNVELPNLVWLKIKGKAGYDDFGMSHEYLLVISEKALSIFKSHNIKNCDVKKFSLDLKE